MRICVVSTMLGPAFEALGHEVLTLWPKGPARVDLAALLHERGFSPDLVIQQENLGPRVLLENLDALNCPTVFWSLDTHLNLFWHAWYIRRFHGLATPHMAFLPREPALPAATPRLRLPVPVESQPWTPFAHRSKACSFVGRFTEHRPLRQRMATFLRSRLPEDALAIEETLARPAMFALYRDTMLAPNESIAGEVNFRLLEAASCGCLVLSQDVGEDQNALLAPGRELAVHDHILELEALLTHYRARPEVAERMGRAAWERVQAEHLAIHRAEALLAFAETLPVTRGRGLPVERARLLTEAELALSLRFPPANAVQAELATLAGALGAHDDPECQAMRVRTLFALEGGPAHRPVLREALLQAAHAQESALSLDLAASTAALLMEDMELARFFLRRRQHTAHDARGLRERPQSPASFCMAWAETLLRAGPDHAAASRLGQYYDDKTRLPTTADQCLALGLRYAPGDLAFLRRLDALYAGDRGFANLRLACLSERSLRQRKDWRLGLSLGMLNLQCFRREEGLEEIRLARHNAQDEGKLPAFDRMLESLDERGSVRRLLTRQDAAASHNPGPDAVPDAER